MKTKKLGKKLNLTKSTVADLSHSQQNALKGGGLCQTTLCPTDFITEAFLNCSEPTIPTGGTGISDTQCETCNNTCNNTCVDTCLITQCNNTCGDWTCDFACPTY